MQAEVLPGLAEFKAWMRPWTSLARVTGNGPTHSMDVRTLSI